MRLRASSTCLVLIRRKRSHQEAKKTSGGPPCAPFCDNGVPSLWSHAHPLTWLYSVQEAQNHILHCCGSRAQVLSSFTSLLCWLFENKEPVHISTNLKLNRLLNTSKIPRILTLWILRLLYSFWFIFFSTSMIVLFNSHWHSPESLGPIQLSGVNHGPHSDRAFFAASILLAQHSLSNLDV